MVRAKAPPVREPVDSGRPGARANRPGRGRREVLLGGAPQRGVAVAAAEAGSGPPANPARHRRLSRLHWPDV